MEHLPTRIGTKASLGSGIRPVPGDFYTTSYTDLTVISLTPDMHQRTCGYWYLVQTKALSHTAFASEKALLQWLQDRGLLLNGELPERGTHAVLRVAGSYRTTSHLSYDDFYRLEGDRVRHLSNGDYTLGIITTDEDGVRNVHYLNSNMLDRPVFDYQASRELLN